MEDFFFSKYSFSKNFVFIFFSLTRTTQYTEFFFFLPRCQNVYDFAGSFSHALYSRMVDQTKKMASVVGSFEAMFFLR